MNFASICSKAYFSLLFLEVILLININYIIKRIICLIPILLVISILTFSMNKLIPGDSAELILREKDTEITEQNINELREKMGLNKPFFVQYSVWMKNVIKGDLGTSFRSGESVSSEIIQCLPYTLKLALASLLIMFIVSIPLGILSALYKDSIFDTICKVFSFIGISMPSFFLGLLLMYRFAVKFPIFPLVKDKGIKGLILPCLTLGIVMAASYIRLIRSSILQVLQKDYIKYARAKGLREKVVILDNAVKNALIPIITAFGMSFGNLMGGTVIIENIFSWPGIGRLVLQSILNRDYPVIQAYVLVMAVIFVLINLLVDISYFILDPRISIEGESLNV